MTNAATEGAASAGSNAPPAVNKDALGLLDALRYVRKCMDTGVAPAEGIVDAAIARAKKAVSLDEDGLEKLDTRLRHLRAQLIMTYGETGAAFRCLRDDYQDDYLWGCFELADECSDSLRALRERGVR
jgi:hypothetical protein